MPFEYAPIDDDVYKRALGRLSGDSDSLTGPVSPLSIANNPPPQAASSPEMDAPSEDYGTPPSDGPEQSPPAAKAPSIRDSPLFAPTEASILQRLAQAQQGPDLAGYDAATTEGNRRSAARQIGGAFDQAAVGQFHGGNSDPAAFLGLLQRGNQNAIENTNQESQQLRQAPVQKWMTLQAQKKLGLGEAKDASKEAIDFLKQQRLENGKHSAWSPQELEAHKQSLRALFPEMIAKRPDLLDNLSPDNYQQTLVTLRGQDRNQSVNDRFDQAREDRLAHWGTLGDQANRRMDIAVRNTEAREMYNAIRGQAVGQAGLRLYQTMSQGVIPGFEIDHPLPTQVAKDLMAAHGATKAVVNLKDILVQQYGDVSNWGLLTRDKQEGIANATMHALMPWMNMAEMKGVFSMGHAANLKNQVSDIHSLTNMLHEGRLPAILDDIEHTVQMTLDSRADAVGARALQDIRAPSLPGRIKSAPAGTPGAKGNDATSGIPGMPGQPKAAAPRPAARPAPAPGAVTFIIKGKPTPITDPADVAKARAAGLKEVPGG